ncbi:hypothetical protein [Streptomyces sp. NPDC054834]
MRKYQKAAVVMALLGSVSFLGAGTSQAHGDEDGGKFKLDNKQTNLCSADRTYLAGTQTGSDLLLPTNTTGLQFADKSEHSSNDCTNVLAIGH